MLSVLLAMLMPAPASAAPANPEWLRRPSYDDVKRYYPEAAQKAFLTGRATISCSVTAQGTLSDCAVASEEPAGEGFGDAALRMQVLFKMRPTTRDGVPVDGGTVRIPIRFGLPTDLRLRAVRARAPAYAGTTIELNCRFRQSRLDNCYSPGVPLPPAAVDAALELSKQITLPPIPRPVGRIDIAFQFVP